MTIVKRLRLLTAGLGLAAASAVVGTTVFGDIRGSRTTGPNSQPGLTRADRDRIVEDMGRTRFTDLPALSYKHPNGSIVFAWQVQPKLPPMPSRPRDVLVLVDTSASQAGPHLQRARHLIDGLAQVSGPQDRISVWTANLNNPQATRSLTNGFKPAQSDTVRTAAATLTEIEYAAGATDLKASLENALATFESDPGRQRVVLFLGDGESTASTTPLNESARVELGHQMEQRGVTFFAVPLGIKVNAHNLHGLATLTGGTVVRLTDDLTTTRGRSNAADKIKAAFNVPILRPEQVQFGAEVAEVFPTRLPPLRTDRPTLVVGTLKESAGSLTAQIQGRLADGTPHSVSLAERLPVSEPDNYFLHAMVEQWRTAAIPDAPAILQADRALALGSQQFRLFREEFLSQAVFAVSSHRLDHAVKLYEAALKIDPTNSEAVSGLKVVNRMKSGELTHNKLKAEVENFDKLRKALVAGKIGAINLQDPPPAPAGEPPAPPSDVDLLQQAQVERQVQEQQFRVLVDDTIRRARQMLRTDPNTAYEDLKRQRDIVLANPVLGSTVRSRLVADLEQMMQTVATQGAVIQRELAAERERIARTRLQMNEFERQQTLEEQTRARIDAFKQLMNQARYELAQQEAQIMIQERISRGQNVPPEALASYMIGQAATNLREHLELVRIREDRYLLSMMQVEKAFIPYPDEPPVHFPPAAVWRELTADRVERYSSTSLGEDIPPSMRRLQSILDGPTAQRVRIEAELDTLPLRDIIDSLEKQHDIKIIVLEDAFRAIGEANLLEKRPTVKQRLTGVTVGTFLDIVLQSVGATYIVRPEYIEITTIDKRLEEKVVRAFDVTELALMIPSSVNQATLFQNFQLLGANLALFGQATFAGGFGAIGGLGLGGFGALGIGGGLGLGGGLGAGGFGGGGLGAPGGAGVLGAMGAGNQLGVGGGVAGFGGGQLGQFGNLGGQFGIQGNDASPFLVALIVEVVARGEWSTVNPLFQFPQDPNQQQFGEDPVRILPENQLNSLGFYPPARALIVRGTSRYHPQQSIKLRAPDMAAGGGPGNPARVRDVAQAAPNNPPAAAPANNGNQVAAAAKPRLNNPQDEVREFLKGLAVERGKPLPARIWQEALDRNKVTDPGLIVACADFLFDGDEAKAKEYAAEVLKAGIRRGLTSDVWAYDALAIALKEMKASPAEVKRAALSAIDLEPTEAKGYLKAAKVADEIGDTDLALAFCQRAADLEPNIPLAYANALVYAEKAPETRFGVIHWASDNLLRRDWTSDGIDYHAEARARLGRLAQKFEETGRVDQAERIKKTLEQQNQRDLVIELLWQGTADLDLIVSEPSGSVASATNKRTTGGGVLKCDILEQGPDNRSEVYTAAEAFSGTYIVSAKVALGRPIGNKATLKVTKFAGTDRQTFEIHSLDLSNLQPIEIHLEGGSRTELAELPVEEPRDWRLESVPNLPNTAPTGLVAGTGSSTGVLPATGSGLARPNMPAVIQPLETKIPGVAPNAPQMRAVADVSPDRTKVTIKANPVFSGQATDLPLPKVSLLPGSDR
jgi:tetratricopeptide (TPR) repeat protein